MGPFLFCTLLALGQTQQPAPKGGGGSKLQDPEFVARRSAANNKFRQILKNAKTLSVEMTIQQPGDAVQGHGTLILVQPSKLYYHLTWGKQDYTYTILNGEATEIDKVSGSYDQYAVPGWHVPDANVADWMPSYFPAVFITPQIVLPPSCFDADGHVVKYAIGSGGDDDPKKNILHFSDYKIDEPVPDSKFVLKPYVGLTAYSTPREAPPRQIGETIPNLHLLDGSGHAVELIHALGGKPTLLALLDPECAPSESALAFLKTVKGTSVIVLNDNAKGSGLKAASLPIFHDPAGGISSSLRAPMTPLFYLVDGSGKIENVWYAFDRNNPAKFSKEIAEAISELKG